MPKGFLRTDPQPPPAFWAPPTVLWGGFSPGGGNKGLLQLSSLLSGQRLHVSHVHCGLLQPPSRQNSLGPQGSVGKGGMAVPWDRGPEPFLVLLEATPLPTPAHPGAPTLCGIEGPVGGREAPGADATVCPKEHHQLLVRGDEARWGIRSTEPARAREQPWAGGSWPTQGVPAGLPLSWCSRPCQRGWDTGPLTHGT